MARSHGFTLIELLVVIAIIAILAAILFPVFERARAKAQQAQCLSNEKQLTLGCLMYCTDNDDTMPGGEFTNGVWIPYWSGRIYPYVKNGAIFYCPASPADMTVTYEDAAQTDPYPTDYHLNCAIGDISPNNCCTPGGYGTSCTGPPQTPLRQSVINKPAQMILLFEGDGPGTAGYNNRYNYTPACAESNNVSGVVYKGGSPWLSTSWDLAHYYWGCWVGTHHNTGSNVGFCDGHVKWLSAQILYMGDDSAGWENFP
jgi:prepilin-type N-terminal cleavage/methylation domain-containing protein/prepilin-type processing-associated H-X9-DG protein